MWRLQRNKQLKLYEQVMANMASGVSLIRVSDGTIVYANPKFENIFGYGNNELLGMHLSRLNAPTDKSPEETAKEITKVLKQTGEWHGEVNNIKKDGTPFWCYADVSTFDHSTYGKVFIAIHNDISERVLNREKLKNAQLLLKASMESPKDLIILSIDNEYRYMFFNSTHKATMKTVYGIDIKTGMNILDCISEKQDRELAKDCYGKALEGMSFMQINEYGETSKRLYYETHYNPIYNEKNVIIGATAFAKEITERKKIEIALKESEERFKKLSDLTFEGIIIHKNGVCIDVNKAVEKIVGYKREELIGKNLIKLIVPQEFHETIYRNLTDNTPEHYEFIAKRQDGNLINVQFGARKEIIYKGEKVLVSSARDITEYKKNELKVKKSEADLISQIENTTDSIWSVDKNYKITITNSNFYHYFKITFNHELMLGDRVLDYLPESLIKIWKDRYDRALRGEHFSEVDEFDYENAPRFVETSFNPIVVDNKIEGATCFARDITIQKKTEKALKASEEKFKELSDLSPACISIQKTHQFLYVNKAWEKLSGYTKEEALSMSPLQIIHPDVVDELKQRSELRLEGESVPIRHDVKILTKSNEVKWIDVSLSVIEYKNVTASLAVYFDITELKNAKQALQKSEHELKIANTTKNKFFSVIAHDLRSPISAILGYSNLLNSNYSELRDKERKEYINNLYETSNQIFSLTENLLNWSRSQLGGIVINKVLVNLKNLIDSAIELYMPNANHKKIAVKNSISNEISIKLDEYTMMIVLRNLFNNAVKFTNNGGSIELKVHENKNDVIIAISDTGIGMSQGTISKLFVLDESFSTSGTNKEKGTGLGLILCKDFIELNGGSLSVESEKGKGSTFKIILPR